jgi:tetratricopeptide (TPR) repeat protein
MTAIRTSAARSWPAALAALFLAACAQAAGPGEGLTAGTDADPASVSGLYLAGRHAQIERDGRVAADFLLRALEDDPDEPHLLRRAFAVLAFDGRFDEAYGLAERLQATDADAVLTHYVLWLREAKAERWAAARAHLDGAPSDGIRRFVEPILRAWSIAGEGRADDAVAALGPLGRIAGAAALHDLTAGQIMDLAGRPDEAIAFYREVTEGQNGLSARLAQMLGAVLEREGRTDEARALYDRYITENPRSVLLQPTIERFLSGAPPEAVLTSAHDGAAEALFSIAGALRHQDAAETALVLCRMALHLHPNLDVAQLLTAEILEDMQRYGYANEVYAAIAADSPLRHNADLRMVENLDQMDRTDEAIDILDDMAERLPDDPSPLVNKGNILRRAERFDEAVVAYDAAFERVPEVQPHHWSMLYARGIALERTKQWPRAETDFLKALEYEPDQPYILNYLGYSWVDRGEHLTRALDMIRKAVELRPTDGYIVDSLGWVHYKLGEFEAAVRELERAAELRPTDPVINDHLGDAYWRVGRRYEARSQWRRALSFDPDPDVGDAIRDKLETGLPPFEGVLQTTIGGDG